MYITTAAAPTMLIQPVPPSKSAKSGTKTIYLNIFTTVPLLHLVLIRLVVVFPKSSMQSVRLLLPQPVTAAAPFNVLLNHTRNELRCMPSVLQMCNST